MRLLTPHYVKAATTIIIADWILLAVAWMGPSELAWVHIPVIILNIPAFPFVLLDALGDRDGTVPKMSTAHIVYMNAAWGVVSGLAWALVVCALLRLRGR
jgi:hypothetical protein